MVHASQVSFSELAAASSFGAGRATVAPRRLNHLRALEAESIHILREAAAEFSRPVMLYSIGKDSSVMLRLAQKAFSPGRIPFPLLHIDTSYKFPEMIEFRDTYTKQIGAELIVHKNQADLDAGANPSLAGNSEMLRAAEDEIASGRACRKGLRRRVWRSAPRRGEVAGERKNLLVPRSLGAMGSEESAPRALEYF